MGLSPAVQAQDAVEASSPVSPHPTPSNLSLEWEFAGDDNANASVAVRYRRVDGGNFAEALPLRRVSAGSNAGHSWSNRFAGSIFALEPDVLYEVELVLTDPDGGDQSATLEVATRPIPADAADAREVRVSPDSLRSALSAARPGDVLVLEAGSYPAILVDADGSVGQPIVIRGADRDSVIVDEEIRLDGRQYVHVEDVTVRGRFKFNSARGIVVRGCTIETDESGIISYADGVEDAYIAHNTILGPTEWKDSALGVDGDNLGEGVQITGPGNVIAFNRISGFRDCISLLESDEAFDQTSIDIYGNDLDNCADDGIEADYAMGNVRVYGNRIRQSFMGISSQPSLGGPTYFIRNVMYNVIYEAFKLHNGSVGDVVLHNTVVKSGDALAVYTDDAISQAYFRNNLFLGGPGGSYGGYDSGDGQVINLRSMDETCSLDYDGLGSVNTGEFSGRLGDARFSSFEEMIQVTTEEHAVEVNLDVFDSDVPLPEDPFAPSAEVSMELRADGAAVDRAVLLPNINGGFTGDAPDLGAYEVGLPLPEYGPLGELPTAPAEPGGGDEAAAGDEPVFAEDAGTVSEAEPSAEDTEAAMATDSVAGEASETDASGDSSDGARGADTTQMDGEGEPGGDDPSVDGEEREGEGCGCVVGARSRQSSAVWVLLLVPLIARRFRT